MLKLVPSLPDCDAQEPVDNNNAPESSQESAWFVEIDGLIYPTINHPHGQSPNPWYRIEGDDVFPHTGHPCGPGMLPWFTKRGDTLIALAANVESWVGASRLYRIMS